ncbi:MAG: hypothetical protein AAF289_03555 [Cyanobacteria bacterium P01_A01_bin.135]
MAQASRIAGVIVAGHGVASGKAKDSPYPRSTIEMQRPYFQQLGLDLSGFFSGTLNVSIQPYRYRLLDPEYTFRRVTWTDRHPPEDFSFCRCRLGVGQTHYDALIYYPHPETKRRNFQDAATLEVLAPYITGLKLNNPVDLYYNPQTLKIIPPDAPLRS